LQYLQKKNEIKTSSFRVWGETASLIWSFFWKQICQELHWRTVKSRTEFEISVESDDVYCKL